MWHHQRLMTSYVCDVVEILLNNALWVFLFSFAGPILMNVSDIQTLYRTVLEISKNVRINGIETAKMTISRNGIIMYNPAFKSTRGSSILRLVSLMVLIILTISKFGSHDPLGLLFNHTVHPWSVCRPRQGSTVGFLLLQCFSGVVRGVYRNTFLSSPYLCFIIVFICDLFVSRDDPLMS